MTTLPPKSIILWDNDGVLVDTEPFYHRATHDALADMGVHVSLEKYQKNMVEGRSNWLEAASAGHDDHAIRAGKATRDRRYQQYLKNEPLDIPGAAEIVAALAAHCRMAIVTTSRRIDFDLIHGRRDMVRHMEFVLANGDYSRSKPAPDPYLAALARFDVGPEVVVAVEDSERGLKSAVAAGIDCVVVHNEFTAGQDFSSAAAQIRSLGALPGLLGVRA